MATYDRASSSASSSSSPSIREGGEAIAEDSLYVAVSREFAETKSVLLWAIENRGDSQICILHVHQPQKPVPTEMGRLPLNHRVAERDKLSKKLDKHLQFCSKHGVKAGKIHVEMDSIEEGIVKLISEKKIRKLVIGAAIDRRYVWDMMEIQSKKAMYVHQCAPLYCHIWFICKKFLIHTREATEKHETSNPVNFEAVEQLRPAPSYTIGGLLDAQVDDESLPHYSASAPNLTSQIVTDEQKGIDAWLLLAQQRQKPYDLITSSTTSREGGKSPYSEGLENVQDQENKISEELQSHISSLESRIVKSQLIVEQMERRLESAVELVESFKKERDDMLMERDNAIKQVEELRKQPMEGASLCVDLPTLSSELPFQDLEKATNKFDPSLKIEEDAYGIIYKGFFRVEVAVKVPYPSSSSAPQEFQQEVEILSKLRHPNIVNLIGICPESQAIIYEYCSRNLEDQLNSNVEGSLLLWQTRMRIAVELCNVLIFLHSHKPHPIIHGDLRTENIHLDSKYTCKLNDFRTSNAISRGTFILENTERFYRADSRAISYAYTDPEYFATRELTTRSDVYSYGIILLRLLTGKPAVRLMRQVQIAVDTDELGALLDPLAGWPLEQAKQLAALALWCCKITSDKRPDLEPDVWKVLEYVKGLCN